jgi:hypothetical protein
VLLGSVLEEIAPENPEEAVECAPFNPFPFAVLVDIGGVFRLGMLSSLVTSMLSSVIKSVNGLSKERRKLHLKEYNDFFILKCSLHTIIIVPHAITVRGLNGIRIVVL